MAASWRRNEGREDGRRTRKGPQRRALSRLFKPGGEAPARGLPKGGWGCLGFRALEEAGGYSLCGFVLPPPPPTIPPSFWPPPTTIAPTLFSCPVRVSAVSRQHWHEGRWRRGPSWSLEGLESPQRPWRARRRLERDRKNNLRRNTLILSLWKHLKLKGCEWRHLNGGPPLPPACLRMPRSLATPGGGSLALQGDHVVVLNAVGYNVLVSVRRRLRLLVFCWFGGCGFRWRRKLPSA